MMIMKKSTNRPIFRPLFSIRSGIRIRTGAVMCIAAVLTVLLAGRAGAQKAELTGIKIVDDPFALELMIAKQVPLKVIQVEPGQILIALKGVHVSPALRISGKNSRNIQDIGVEELQREVVAVLVKGRRPFDGFQSSFDRSRPGFHISFGHKTAGIPEKPAVKKPRLSKKAVQADTIKTPPVPEPPAAEKIIEKKTESAKPAAPRPEEPPTPAEDYYQTLKRPPSPYSGDISDLVSMIRSSPCSGQTLDQALGLLEKNMFTEAFARLDKVVQSRDQACMEPAFFLRAYAFFKTIEPDNFLKLFQAERFFQDALIAFPESEWIPFGFAAMALIQESLNNDAAAEGFLNIIKERYPDYPGQPEVTYLLARIYAEKGFTDKALRYFEQVFVDSPLNRYTIDAGLGYGQMLYAKQRYVDSLSVFNHIIRTQPRKIYESSTLLLNAGNANYKLGRARPARENLLKAVNLFPDIEDKDQILSMAADTYGMENNIDKARQLYQYVIDTFPDTQGFISSAIGLARYLDEKEEKINIYEMVKKRFPDDKYARVAMMRLAEIYQDSGEYEKCIKEIEDLLSTHPRGLRYEAVKLMQRAYEALFKIQNKADEYTSVLNLYEEKHETIDRMGSREISLRVGLAYLRGGLYEEAFSHLLEAYKLFTRNTRSPQLLYSLGVAMDETGRREDALKLFTSYVKRFPKDGSRVDAMIRMGEAYREISQGGDAEYWFKRAYEQSDDPLERGMILVRHSAVLSDRKEYENAAGYLTRAVKDIASASGENYNVLTDTYRELGNTYLKLEKYVMAAGAFSKALTFSDTERGKANLGFLMGDAYQKGNAIEKARDAFESVAGSDDSVWARLARQRLATLELADNARNS